MNLIPAIGTTASALEAYRTQLDVVSQNIANAHTTRGENGQPYQRQMVSFETMLLENGKSNAVRIPQVVEDSRPGPLVHQPEHPHADEQGFVRLTNVNLSYEMVDLISASRAYEANLSVAKTSRMMAQKTLEIGR